MKILINNVSKTYREDSDDLHVLDKIKFKVEESELVVVIGPSGCGKSTLLRTIAGLVKPDNGEIVFSPRLKEIKIPIIWQEHRLFPWRTSIENVALGLEIKKDRRSKKTAQDYLKMVGLSGFENYYPHQLSEGMKQRVAIARALAIKPDALLLDEPFSSVDYQIKMMLQKEIREIQRDLKIPMIYVTHDIRDALSVSRQIVVLSSRPAKVKEIIKIPETNADPQKAEEKIQNILKKEYQSITSEKTT